MTTCEQEEYSISVVRIESKRAELMKAVELLGYAHPFVLSLSIELDELLNKIKHL